MTWPGQAEQFNRPTLADVVQLIAQIFWTGLAMAVPTGPVPFSTLSIGTRRFS
jgi:surfactin synthase thioesterase subunit